jgi:hypothetical protein
MNNYVIDKFLAEGLMGKVYLVHKKNKKYAMKVEYIQSKDDRYLKNELQFVKDVASKHPEQFIQLIDYRIVENCKAEAPPIKDFIQGKELEWIKKLRESGVCVEKVYSLIDTSLDQIPISNMKLCELYSMLIQTLYICYLFEKNDYVHGDFHHGNVGVIKVPTKQRIKIFGNNIPTYGYLYKAIDYGGILHKSNASKTHLYQQNDITEYEHFKNHKIADKLGIIGSMWDERKFWEFIEKNEINMKGYEHDVKLILKQDEIKYIREMTDNIWIQFDLFKLLFTQKFQKVILGKNFKKTIEFKTYAPLVDIIYCLTNIENIENVIHYLITRLHNVIDE